MRRSAQFRTENLSARSIFYPKTSCEVKAVSADKAKQLARYKKLLTKDFLAKGDAANGRTIFVRTCAACHTLYDTGGKVGPDITGSNRGDLNYILYQVVDPNDDGL